MPKDIPKLDQINLSILETLQLEARISNQDLAERVGLSPSACLARVRQLEAAGYVRRYIADMDVNTFSSTLTAFVEITLDSHFPKDFEAFDAAIAALPEVVASYKVSGRFDYLLQIICSDMQRLRELSDRMLEAGIGIAKFTTIPIIEQPKQFSGFPLRTLAREGR